MNNLNVSFKKADLNKAKTAIESLKSQEAETRKIVNSWTPDLIAGVWAGDNVSTLNRLLGALSRDRRRAVSRIIKPWVPNDWNSKGLKFGKRTKNQHSLNTRLERFNEFLQSGRTIFGELDLQAKGDEKRAEISKADRLLKQINTAMKGKNALSQSEVFDVFCKALDIEAPDFKENLKQSEVIEIKQVASA